MYNRAKKLIIIPVLVTVYLVTLLVAVIPPSVSQAAPYSKDNSVDKAKAWLFGRAVGQCFKEVPLRDFDKTSRDEKIDKEHVESGEWFQDRDLLDAGIHGGIYVESVVEGKGDDSKFNCNEKSLISNALPALGWGNDGAQALCDMGFTRDNGRQ